ncbi:hypothetical protein N7455_003150 [Penicillium solitum]|uniref:uncharacterized protein n=1 Tax=Penicillium solitum TaxID=60172 RepID=UPI001812BEBE|nr:hypothetical protein HAV15_006763 [Penicillium sp. str. \
MFQELQSMPGFNTIINIWNGELCLVKDPVAYINSADFLAYSSAIATETRCQRLSFMETGAPTRRPTHTG